VSSTQIQPNENGDPGNQQKRHQHESGTRSVRGSEKPDQSPLRTLRPLICLRAIRTLAAARTHSLLSIR